MASGVDRSLTVHEDQEQMLRHLAHELRQPLSGIESIAYYLDMVLAAESPQIQLQCERLRRMVQHAHWLIEDAALALRLQGTELAPVCLQDHLIRIGTEMALHEERNLEICLAEPLTRALMPAELTHAFCQHLLAFFRGVAQARDPIRVNIENEAGFVRLDIQAEVEAELDDLLRAIDPPPPGSGVRRIVTYCSGQLQAMAEGQMLALSVHFPSVE
ncbi:HAMP domain-containing histidine kinase [Paludibaculum fermentans]|uniref:histidine kinase n=1 Tax=Paludibaculum fermentans TaxID=1473598 RepID=A0A7S7SJY8_PALFE|nr:HAMP domain-containing histidine kinase [Paludibaculum fermentans]QOY86931.1 HAMP domain-containing histidine kinase [Paludibaculum fermentans]